MRDTRELATVLGSLMAEVNLLRKQAQQSFNQGQQIMATQQDIINALQGGTAALVAAKTTISSQEAQIASLQASVATLTAQNGAEVDPKAVEPDLDALIAATSDLHAAIPPTTDAIQAASVQTTSSGAS